RLEHCFRCAPTNRITTAYNTRGYCRRPVRFGRCDGDGSLATVSSTCTFHLAAALRLIVMISKRCSQSWRVKSKLLSEERKPSFELAKPSTFQRTHLINSKTRTGNRPECYACARRRGKKSFSKK